MNISLNVRVWLVSACIVSLFSACATSSGKVLQTSYPAGVKQTVVLSNYFESKVLVADKVLVHLILTLGDERLPEDYRSPLSWSDRKLRDRIDIVEEIYLSNQSGKPVTISNLTLDYFSKVRLYIDQPTIIAPGSFIKTKKNIGTTSVYRAARTRKLNITVDGQSEEIVFNESRTVH